MTGGGAVEHRVMWLGHDDFGVGGERGGARDEQVCHIGGGGARAVSCIGDDSTLC